MTAHLDKLAIPHAIALLVARTISLADITNGRRVNPAAFYSYFPRVGANSAAAKG